MLPEDFDAHVKDWLAYLESTKGRIRREIARHNLKGHLTHMQHGMTVLDAGCGVVDAAYLPVEEARSVVFLDFSEKMLDAAKARLAEKYGPSAGICFTFILGGVEHLETLLPHIRFDLILCHNLLEYVEQPRMILGSLIGKLNPGGILSLIAANRFSEPVKKALVDRDLEGALLALNQTECKAGVFGNLGKKAFSLRELEELVKGFGLIERGRYGIRVFTDYLETRTDLNSLDYDGLLKLEKEASGLLPYVHIARYIHLVLEKTDSTTN